MLCVCVMSQVPGTSRNTMMNFTCGLPRKFRAVSGKGERKQPGATGKGVPCSPAPHTHHLSLDFLPLLLTQGPWALQSSSHCDLVGGVLPWNLLRWGWRFFPGTSSGGSGPIFLVSNSALFLCDSKVCLDFFSSFSTMSVMRRLLVLVNLFVLPCFRKLLWTAPLRASSCIS